MTDRILHLVPILHAEADLGALADEARAATGSGWTRKQRVVEELWTAIERWATGPDVDARSVHVFQDGLPLCGQEARIVADLAQQGSRNHRLLARLIDGGATLHGTESPELLLAEYEMVRRSLENGGAPVATDAEAAELLRQRDAFIASRIDAELPSGGTGILFIGLLHDVAAHLPADVEVRHPVGHPGRPGGSNPNTPAGSSPASESSS